VAVAVAVTVAVAVDAADNNGDVVEGS
jgi:hypothetical protein